MEPVLSILEAKLEYTSVLSKRDKPLHMFLRNISACANSFELTDRVSPLRVKIP